VSVPVELERLHDEVLAFGPTPYLLTVTDDGRPHAVSATVSWEDDGLVAPAGRTSARNAAARPDVTLLWPPVEPGGYSLIVDGTAAVEDVSDEARHIVIRPAKAVLHRSAPAPEPGGCAHDCVPVLPS
jgi:hypothetical protein